MSENTQNNKQYGVTTDEIMDYLKDNMVIKTEFNEVKDDLKELRKDMNKMKLDIIDHVDEKLADLKGDLVILMRKEDKKLISLIELLINKKLITSIEAKSIFQMEPFPQLII